MRTLGGVIQISWQGARASITYDTSQQTGRKIHDQLLDSKIQFQTYDPHLEAFRAGKKDSAETFTKGDLVIAAILVLFFLITCTIVPLFESHVQDTVTFPLKWGVCSIYLIVNLLASVCVIALYGRQTFYLAYANFVKDRSFSVETLTSLGSLGAIALVVYLITIDYSSAPTTD